MPTPIDRLLVENYLFARLEHAESCDPSNVPVPDWLAAIAAKQAAYRNATAALERRLAVVGEIDAYGLTFALSPFGRVTSKRGHRFPLRKQRGVTCAA